MDVPNSNKLQLRKVKRDVLKINDIDQLKLQALYLTDKTVQFLYCVNLASHIHFFLLLSIQRRQFFPIKIDVALLKLFSYLIRFSLLKLVYYFFFEEGGKEMRKAFVMIRFDLNLHSRSFLTVFYQKLERGVNFYYCSFILFLHFICYLSFFEKPNLYTIKEYFRWIFIGDKNVYKSQLNLFDCLNDFVFFFFQGFIFQTQIKMLFHDDFSL